MKPCISHESHITFYWVDQFVHKILPHFFNSLHFVFLELRLTPFTHRGLFELSDGNDKISVKSAGIKFRTKSFYLCDLYSQFSDDRTQSLHACRVPPQICECLVQIAVVNTLYELVVKFAEKASIHKSQSRIVLSSNAFCSPASATEFRMTVDICYEMTVEVVVPNFVIHNWIIEFVVSIQNVSQWYARYSNRTSKLSLYSIDLTDKKHYELRIYSKSGKLFLITR